MGHKVLVFESDAAFAGELRNELGKLGCTTNVVDDGNHRTVANASPMAMMQAMRAAVRSAPPPEPKKVDVPADIDQFADNAFERITGESGHPPPAPPADHGTNGYGDLAAGAGATT